MAGAGTLKYEVVEGWEQLPAGYAHRDVAATRLQDYQAQVRAALAALPRPRVLVGASLGGLLALDAAEGADAVVLVNPLPPVPWHVDSQRYERDGYVSALQIARRAYVWR